MISDYALKLSENQVATVGGGAVTDHVVDLLQARNIGVGEQLFAVISITTTFVPSAGVGDNPLIQWVFYESASSAKTDSGSAAHQIGSSAIYSCDVLTLGPNNLKAGNKISVPLSPITAPRSEYTDFTTTATDGRRYIYGGYVVTGTGTITAGAFSIEIVTQAQFGGRSDASHVPIYPSSYTVK